MPFEIQLRLNGVWVKKKCKSFILFIVRIVCSCTYFKLWRYPLNGSRLNVILRFAYTHIQFEAAVDSLLFAFSFYRPHQCSLWSAMRRLYMLFWCHCFDVPMGLNCTNIYGWLMLLYLNLQSKQFSRVLHLSPPYIRPLWISIIIDTFFSLDPIHKSPNRFICHE